MNTSNNRLGAATSAYLRQHANNPVDWFTWGAEALEKARRENRPILLSIGYAACHWCHVMARESFEDPDTAAVMNAHFVNIKVDREERPDLDHIYQAAHQLLTRQPGGWPLTVFLAPDQAPFFSGTYFPREARFGLPGFRELLHKVAAAFAERPREVADTGVAVREALARLAQPRPIEEATGSVLEAARRAFAAAFDLRYGGLGSAPKFPRAAELDFCLAAAHAAGDRDLRQAVLFSLRRMAAGGLQDHLAGGFFRYCVDGFWDIPHFEKMLYDNALLLKLYADAFALEGDASSRQAAEGIVRWLVAEMSSPEGLFYSSLDADAEHEEGKYYVWRREEVKASLTPAQYEVFAEAYGLQGNPNFEGHAWHLRELRSVAEIAASRQMPVALVEQRLDQARASLLSARARRARPGLDDKHLCSWNALAIGALARASRVFGQPEWLRLARLANDALRAGVWRGGQLHALSATGGSSPPAYLDDYAFLLEATLELMEVDYRQEDSDFARALAEVLLKDFGGADGGGFYFTAANHEALLARMRTGFDQATPAGNGVAAKALLRLGHLCAEPRYLDAAAQVLNALAPRSGDPVEGQGAMLGAQHAWEQGPELVWLRGADSDLAPWRQALPRYRPELMVISLGEAEGPPAAPPPLAFGQSAAWVCRRGTCSPPLVNFSKFLAVMGLSAS